jgi:hypothetical protein
MQTRFAIAALLLSLLVLSVAGCASRPLTHQMRSLYQLDPETIRQVQVYTSREIVLERRVDRKRAEASSGRELLLRESELIRRIRIPKGTPGVIVGVEEDRLEVQFEPGGTLIFGSTEKNRSKLEGLYHLMALRWINGRGVVKYGGELFLTQPGAGKAYLVVRARDAHQTKVVSKTVRGMTVPQAMEPTVAPPFSPDETSDTPKTNERMMSAEPAHEGS